MAYSYAVNGEYFSGYYEKMFLSESSADQFAADLKGGRHSSGARAVHRMFPFYSGRPAECVAVT